MSKSYRVYITLWVLIAVAFTGCQQKKPIETKQAQLAFETQALLGEGPIWDAPTQRLYWVDIEGKQLRQFDPNNQQEIAYDMPSHIGTVVTHTDTSVAVALKDGIYQFDLNSQTLTQISNLLSDQPGHRLNDGKCDPQGRLWVGSMHFDQIEGAAHLYKIEPNSKPDTMIHQVTTSNGIVWSRQGDKMYYIDTPTGKVMQYDFHPEDGSISNPKSVIEIPKSQGFPDGMAIDQNNHLWIGLWNGGKVICIDPKQGKQVDEIVVPAHNVTACAFGGKDLKTLYITTASLDMTEEEKQQYPLAGSLFKFQVQTPGIGSTRFGLTSNQQ